MAGRGEQSSNDEASERELEAWSSDVTGLAPARPSDIAPRFRPSGVAPRPASFRPTLPPPSSSPPPVLDDAVLALIHGRFADIAGPASSIDTVKLQRSLDVENAFIAERVVAMFDRDCNGLVSRVEFVRGVPRLLFGSLRDKLRYAFRLHDLDGDGVIDRAELVRMLELGLREDGVAASPQVVERLSEIVLGAADGDRDGRLSFSEFETIAACHPEATALISRSEARWIAPQGELSDERHRAASLLRRFVRFIDNRTSLAVVVTLWVGANAALFLRAALEYRASGHNELIQLARGCGACINLNGALIALTMARRSLTVARRTPLLRLLPLDDSVAIHRWLGGWLFVLALVHTVAHGANWALSAPGIWQALARNTAAWTGLALLLVFAVMWVFSRQRVRGTGHFELFYWTHLLYVAWFALALWHGPVFWLWAGVPLAIFAADRLLRVSRAVTETEVLGCTPRASGVTQLTLEKPPDFTHRAGDYVYLKIPSLAPHEWHPFTISSAPEQRHLTFHVRSLGNFTKALYELARERSRLDPPPVLRAQLDGAFGTASQRIFECRHVVLIGAGIGVTPFASVLESIVLRGRAGREALEKVRFFWLNRDAISFEWFAKLLARLERDAPPGLVDIRIFMTGGRGHVSATFLNLARELAHGLGEADLVTGLATMTRMGAPDWRAELSAVARDVPDTQVFFCGPPGLARAVRSVCSELGLGFHQEQF
jgi:predicted ferric reductase/Ca2+-binding EF-hand superfamily protein